jgi:glutathione S-transferase
MRILYQFPLSHYCEKARWLLDHKELDYEAHNLLPGLHRLKIRRHTQHHTLPVLQEGTQWIGDSSQIAGYLDQHYPEHSLIRKESDLRDRILSLDAKSQYLGQHVRNWLYFYLLQQPESSSLALLLGEKGLLQDWKKLSLPALKFSLRSAFKLNAQTAADAKTALDALILEFNQHLIENGGRYLIGEQLTLADIALCSMLAPILMLEATPWEQNPMEASAHAVLEMRQQLLELPLGQYVQRLYRQERNARVDWRGV